MHNATRFWIRFVQCVPLIDRSISSTRYEIS
jgi:hypothetical protein